MKARRILMISPTPTHPQTAGNRTRISGLLSCLKEMGHDVFFCHIRRERGDEAEMSKAWGDHYVSLPYDAVKARSKSWCKKIAGLFSQDAKYTYGLDDWYDQSVDAEITRLITKHQFDTVIVEYVFFSRALELFGKDVLKIIDTHDAFADRHKKYLENGQIPKWYSTTREEEARGLNRADFVIAIQDKEKEFFAGLTSKQVITVGHLVTLQQLDKAREIKGRLLFVASNNSINVEGIKSFIDEVFPKVREQVPNASLVLAGTVCDAIEDQDAVLKLGRVDDLVGLYETAAIVINPVRYNTGISIKNLEALGYAKPLVTEMVGADGIEDGLGRAFIATSTPEQLRDAIVNLLRNEAFSREISGQAYHYAQNWNRSVVAQLEQILL